MRYLYVKWTHKDPGAPAHIYSEIGDDSYELRKVEIWADGRKGFADSSEEDGGTALGCDARALARRYRRTAGISGQGDSGRKNSKEFG